jgi:hypothetical protein
MYRLAILFLFAVVIVLQLAILLRPNPSTPAATAQGRLAELVWKLHDNGLEFRAVSARPDGLWDDGLYLTRSDTTVREFTKCQMNPQAPDPWSGMVIVTRRPIKSLNDSCFVYQEWTFFGDQEMVDRIRQCLGN